MIRLRQSEELGSAEAQIPTLDFNKLLATFPTVLR
jgi:hypothetical protein